MEDGHHQRLAPLIIYLLFLIDPIVYEPTFWKTIFGPNRIYNHFDEGLLILFLEHQVPKPSTVSEGHWIW